MKLFNRFRFCYRQQLLQFCQLAGVRSVRFSQCLFSVPKNVLATSKCVIVNDVQVLRPAVCYINV